MTKDEILNVQAARLAVEDVDLELGKYCDGSNCDALCIAVQELAQWTLVLANDVVNH